MSFNVTCLMSFFSVVVLEKESKWSLCKEEPHCLCGSLGLREPLCAPPNVARAFCGINKTVTEVNIFYSELIYSDDDEKKYFFSSK